MQNFGHQRLGLILHLGASCFCYGFTIGIKKTQENPVNIPFKFGFNWHSAFGEDWNEKFDGLE